MSTQQFDKIALIGIGLIGSSIARAVKQKGLAPRVSIATRSQETLDRARELDLGTDYTLEAAEAVRDADLVVVSVPVGASGAVAQEIAPHLKPGAIVTDVGSTKGSVVAQMLPHMPRNVHFIPGHPLAGTEHSGPDAGFPELFQGRWCILTPVHGTDKDAKHRLAAFWEALGSKVDEMDTEHHDKVLAIVSHLPHIIAYNIVGLSRFHAPCRLRSHHVARRLPAQQGRDPGNAGAVLGRPCLSAARDPLGRRGEALRPLHPHPRHPPLDHRRRPGHGGTEFRPAGGRQDAVRCVRRVR